MRTMRAFPTKPHHLAAALALVTITTLAPSIHSDDSASRVVVKSIGPRAVRIRIAAGTVFPCDSLANDRLYEGKPDIGASVTLASAAECVCIEHTLEPFVDIGWSPPRVQCRPQICTGYGKARRCKADPDQTIRIEVRSGG